MAFTEFQRILFICFGISFSILFGLVVYITLVNNNQLTYSTIARKIARFVLICSIYFELSRGILHFLFPYKSHTIVSGLAEGFDITDEDLNVLTAMALVTYQLGTVNLIVAFAMMIPFFANDSKLSITLYMLVVKLVVQLSAILNLKSGLLNDIRSHVPKYLTKAYESMEGAQKVPPGKHLHNLEIGLLVVGIVAAVISRRENAQVNKGKDD